jgi:diguanylate cyclase (GGDEF)-like protein/PAS domain S-box-containing protein
MGSKMQRHRTKRPPSPLDIDELKASEKRYRALIEASTSLVWRGTPDGLVLEGWGKDEDSGAFLEQYKGLGWLESIHPDDRPRVRAEWEGPKAADDFKSVEYRLRRGSDYRWVHARALPVRNDDGSICEWIGSLTDIHEERHAIAALKASEERLRLAVESAGLGLWDHDFIAGQTWWSEGKRAVLGLPDDHPIGLQVLLDLVHPGDRAEVDALVEQALDPKGDGKLDHCFRILRANDGAERWVLSVGQVLFSVEGKPARILGTIRDVTERALALEKLRSSEERFRRVAETSPNACVCTDEGGLVTFWNGGAENTFGYSAAEIVGRSIEAIIPERFQPAHREGLRRAASADNFHGRNVELTGLHRDGREFPVEGSLSTWMEGGRRQFGALMRDISERRRNEERLYRLAHYDHLTQLPNRTLFGETMRSHLQAGESLAMLLLDLDGFKTVNDTLGHEAGDRLLMQVAERLAQVAPAAGTLARIGGDEFALALPGVRTPDEALAVAEAFRESLVEAFVVGGRTAFLGASIGVAIAPTDGRSAQELMVNADLALYRAKGDGRNVTRFFAPKLREQTELRQSLEVELRRAYKEGEFELHFQPQVRLQDRVVVGAEALLRWRHPERGLLSPAAFLPVLKRGPLAAAVGEWTLRTACLEAARLKAAGHDIRVGVNLFSAQVRAGDLVKVTQQVLSDTGLPPEQLELEITENIILKGDEALDDTLRGLRSLGVGVAFDDYGTGYASLSMLKRLPLTRLKIDKGFVQNVQSDPGDVGIIEAILQLGRTFNLGVTAEGIETERQEQILLALGCKEAQGFLYSRAVPAEQLRAVLSRPGVDTTGQARLSA